MSGQTPRVIGPVLGAGTASQLPNTGPAEVVIQVAAFCAVVLLTWFVTERLFSR